MVFKLQIWKHLWGQGDLCWGHFFGALRLGSCGTLCAHRGCMLGYRCGGVGFWMCLRVDLSCDSGFVSGFRFGSGFVSGVFMFGSGFVSGVCFGSGFVSGVCLFCVCQHVQRRGRLRLLARALFHGVLIFLVSLGWCVCVGCRRVCVCVDLSGVAGLVRVRRMQACASDAWWCVRGVGWEVQVESRVLIVFSRLPHRVGWIALWGGLGRVDVTWLRGGALPEAVGLQGEKLERGCATGISVPGAEVARVSVRGQSWQGRRRAVVRFEAKLRGARARLLASGACGVAVAVLRLGAVLGVDFLGLNR